MSASYKIHELNSRPALLKKFIALPYRLYADDGKWMPLSRGDLRRFLRGDHPFHSFLDHTSFLIEDSNGRLIGRATAFVNRLMVSEGKPVGSIGFFECDNDSEASTLLINKACQWLKANDVATIWAPVNGTIWSSYRFMTRGFDEIPFLQEPYNKPYYAEMFERSGFSVLKNWYSGIFEESSLQELITKNEGKYRNLLDEGYKFRQLNLQRFDQELLLLRELLFDSYSGFLGFHGIQAEVFVRMFNVLKYFIIPELAYLAVNPQGKPAGFIIMMPGYERMPHSWKDYIQMYGEMFFSRGNNNFKKRKITSIMVLYLGIIHEEINRKSGLGGALMHLGIREAGAFNVPVGIALVAEDSRSTSYLKYTNQDLHEYCLYYKNI